MTCPNCQTANPSGAKFCFNCGNALPQACAHCGSALAPGAKFCFNCGHPVAAPTPNDSQELEKVSVAASAPTEPLKAPAPQAGQPGVGLHNYIPGDLLGKLQEARSSRVMVGDRRVVTILFCDVKGSTSMAETMDPEEWADIMNRAFEYLITPVYKYEGTLARLMGDAILAFFGAPIAHEDDPQRAILAGLEITEGIKPFREQIRRELGLDFNVRVGINTGLVVVGEVGSDMRVEYTAMGDTVNVASRMEQTAEPGTVQVAANTHKSVANLFHFEPLGEIELKGKTEPIIAYRVLRKREGAVPTRGIEGLYSPMVGRERDLQTLQSKLQDLMAGSGRIVSVMGEAGLGKSRLVRELKASVVHDEPPTAPGQNGRAGVAWYEGRSLSYDINTPYAPFLALFQQVFDLSAQDTGEEKYSKICGLVQEIAPGGTDKIAPYLGTLLDATLTSEDIEKVKYLEPPQLRGQIFGAVAAFFGALAGQRPVVLVFEDLHWADPTSLDLLDQLMPLTEHAPLMLLAIFRPQRQEPSWRFHETAQRDLAPRYTSVTLEPLDEQSSRALVSNLLEIEDLPEQVRRLILRKSEGNPFFVEEVIRSLLDNKLVVREGSHWRAVREIENIKVPDTLAGVITARLDRLDENSKRVAQTASVIGREFGYDILDQVCDEPETVDASVSVLQRRELVRERSAQPLRSYMFKHVLTQETAYSSILLSKRREIHHRVAESLKEMEPKRVNEIGRHFMEARESDLALPYLVEAGDQARNAYASKEAITYYNQALDALDKVDDPALTRRVYEGLGGVLMMSGDLPGAIDKFQKMLAYAESHDDTSMKVSAYNKLARSAMFTGRMDELEQNLVASEQLARRYEDLGGLVEMFTVRCGVCNMTGDFEGAERYMGDSLAASRTLNLGPQMAWSLTHTALTLTYMTRFEEAKQKADEAAQFADSIGDLAHLSEVLAYPMPYYFLTNGDLDSAERTAQRSLQIATSANVAFQECMATQSLAVIAHARGEYEKALEYNEQSSKAAEASGYGFMLVYPLCFIGTIYLEISPKLIEKTREYHAKALQILNAPGGTYGLATADVHLGYCAIAQGALDKAAEYFQTGLRVPAPEWLLQRGMLLAGLGLVALSEQRVDEAAAKVDEAHRYVEEHGMKNQRPQIEMALAQVSVAKNERERALQYFANAEKLASGMGMKPLTWQAQVGQAHLLSALGRADEAEQKRRDARTVIDQIAGLFNDGELKSLFLENALNKLETGEEFLI